MYEINSLYKPYMYIKGEMVYRVNDFFIKCKIDRRIFDSLKKLENMSKFDKEEFLLEFHYEEKKEVELFFEQLYSEGIVTEYVWEDRYATNMAYFLSQGQDKKKIQRKISEFKILVLGLGGSSFLMQELSMMGIGYIYGVDYDSVEMKNLTRQSLYREEDIGEKKAEAAKRNIRKMNSGVKVDVLDIKIVCKDQVKEILARDKFDLVVSFIDEPLIESTLWVDQACMECKVKVMSGGVWSNKINIKLHDYQNNTLSESVFENKIEEQKNMSDEAKEYIEKIRNKKIKNLNNTSTFSSGLVGSLMANEIYKIISNSQFALSHLESITMDINTYEVTKENE
jgi:molybdopterin/thiamine biosynthesis adenylyltransferase